MSRSFIPWIILIATLCMDIYGFSAVRHISQEYSARNRTFAYSLYWGMTVYVVFFFILAFSLNLRENSTPITRFMLGIVLAIFVSKLFLTVFLLLQDLMRLFLWVMHSIISSPSSVQIGRRAFIEKISLTIAAMPIPAFVYGMFKTAYDYQVLRSQVPIPNLPDGLNGMKIVQISDIHAGSFGEIEPLRKAVALINSLEPDLFVFTGDLVNNKASEYADYISIFKNIEAPLGKFSILGNHDYGDYISWDTPTEKTANLKKLKEYHELTGWDLLLNDHRILEYRHEKIALIGVENWSAKRGFAQYGNLAKAYHGAEDTPFKILLSHDPSHWDAEVRKQYTDIALTLSGHTHGMQFGVETRWFKFSPVQWVYKQWAGLYTQSSQHLYVNRGFGFIAYPGRVGIKPEITLITLTKA